jgi:endonuclease YncB( thermonuclease family)
VIDGDTVVFEDGEHVRMIGIDTPELGHGDQARQPGAQAAKDWLARRLPRGTPVLAAVDGENRDGHGRLLRHLFLPDGTNLQAEILVAGLATPLTIPPSLGHLACYRLAAKTAEDATVGLWSRPEYRPLEPGALEADTRGYRVIRSRVMAMYLAHGGIRLQLEGGLSAFVPAASRALFDQERLASLGGRFVEIRGMVYPRRGRLQMLLRHPVDLRPEENAGNPATPQASK